MVQKMPLVADGIRNWRSSLQFRMLTMSVLHELDSWLVTLEMRPDLSLWHVIVAGHEGIHNQTDKS